MYCTTDCLHLPVMCLHRNGSDVRGYFVWSLLDNYEWTSGYTLQFGLYHVDIFSHRKRYPKLSAHWFTQFLHHEDDDHDQGSIRSSSSSIQTANLLHVLFVGITIRVDINAVNTLRRADVTAGQGCRIRTIRNCTICYAMRQYVVRTIASIFL